MSQGYNALYNMIACINDIQLQPTTHHLHMALNRSWRPLMNSQQGTIQTATVCGGTTYISATSSSISQPKLAPQEHGMLLTRSKDPYLEVLPVWLKVQLQRLLAA